MDEKLNNEDFELYHSPKDKQNWFQRTFLKYEDGSIRNGIFSLVTTAVGGGLLNLPKAIYNWNIYLGSIMIILGAINLYISSKIFSDLINRNKDKNLYLYTDLVEVILGKKAASILNFIFLFYVWGTLIGYTLVCKDLLMHVFEEQIYTYISKNNKVNNAILCYFIILLSIPLSLKRNTSSLKKYTLIGFFILILYSFVVLFQYIFVFSKETNTYKNNPSIIEKMKTFGIYFYSFNFIVNLFAVRDRLLIPNERRLKKTFYRTLLVLIIIYSLGSIPAYFSLGDNLDSISLFITRPYVSNDWLMKTLCVGLVFANMLSLIIHVIPIKIQWESKLKITSDRTMNFLLTIFILFLPLILSMLFDKVNQVFGIIGAFFAVSIITTFPCMMAFKTYKDKKIRYFYLIWGSIITLCGYSSGIVGIIYF